MILRGGGVGGRILLPISHTNIFTTMLLCALLLLVLSSTPITPTYAFEFNFDGMGIYSAFTTSCIRFRPSSSSPWGYVSASGITPRSAEAFCHTFDPDAPTGTITSSNFMCRSGGGDGEYQYSTNIDCPDKDAPPTSGNCNVTGNMVPNIPTATFYGAGIRCIRYPRWGYSSTFAQSPVRIISPYRTTTTTTTLSITPLIDVTGIRPDDYFSAGTVCLLPSSSTNTTSSSTNNNNVLVGSNVAKALCRTAGLPVSPNSTITNSPLSGAGYTQYISNVTCSSPSTGTLFDGGCTFTTRYYNDTSAAAATATDGSSRSGCSSFLPQVSCPTSFDIKLGNPIVSTGYSGGFQLVQLRPHQLDQDGVSIDNNASYDGTMSVQSSYTSNFANAMCNEMYGADNIDFAAYYVYGAALPPDTKEYLSNVKRNFSTSPSTSSSITNNLHNSTTAYNLSDCFAVVTPTVSQVASQLYRRFVSCKLNQYNTIFSTSSHHAQETSSATSSSSTTTTPSGPGKGYLMASIAATGQTTSLVCYNTNDFNIITARAACRSIGYTPGANVSFTVTATATTSHAINNVSCPTDVHKLTDCKLQYSGIGSKLPSAVRDVCGGSVYLDCDLGPPNVEFRMDTRRYLQARLYSNSEWGRVVVGDDVTSRDGYYAMCAHQTSANGDNNITKSFLYVSGCSPSATSLSDCMYEYTNGASARGKTRFYCSKKIKDKSSSSASGLGLGAIIGLGAGIPAIAIILLFLADKAWSKKKNGNQVNTEEEGVSDEEAAAAAARHHHFVSVEGINSEELMAMEAEFPGERTDEH